MTKGNTLTDFLVQNYFQNSSLAKALLSISTASGSLSMDIRRAGILDHILGQEGIINVQGEAQQKLDLVADKKFVEALESSGVVCGIASEENEDFVAFRSEEAQQAKLVVLFDPLDGSSNIDVNVSIGTIFSIYKRISPAGSPASLEDMLQPGNKQLAAGYVPYGTSTMLVFTSGNGVHGFTLDPANNEYLLTHPNIQSPQDGRIYAMNEGNINECEEGLKKYIGYCQGRENPYGAPYSGRYIGSLVADFHRNMLKGGIYIYPAVPASPQGRLRLLYECNPLAFLAEQSGGLASTGRERILDVVPTSLHQRVPYYVGSSQMVRKAMSFLT